MDLKELMEKRTKAWDEAKAFAESKKDENGLMSDEDLVRKLIKKIIVYDEMFKVIFKSGLEVEINQ